MDALYHSYRSLLDTTFKNMHQTCAEVLAARKVDDWLRPCGNDHQDQQQVCFQRRAMASEQPGNHYLHVALVATAVNFSYALSDQLALIQISCAGLQR